jgi:hypothetical protein
MAMPNRLRSWGPPLAFIAVVSAVLLAIFPKGFPNYDTIYYLLWGREIADGLSPDYGAPLAPTPHPLYDLLGAIFSPLGDGSITVAVVLAYVSLGLLAWLVYRLGKEWFDRPIGFLAAFLVMASAPVLSNGLRAYIDIPYMVLCLAALLIETKKPKAGWPVLVLLALAGLLRPEAWLFAGFYFLWLALDFDLAAKGEEPRGRVSLGRLGAGLRQGGIDRNLVLMACLTAAGPVIWVLFDLITTSNPLYSFTGTRETVETLERDTGPLDVVIYGPRRLGEVMQWPGMVGAFFGVVLTAWAMPKRAAIGIVAAALALIAFALMGASGLAIIPRYTMLAAAILFVFTAAAVLGWRLLEPGHKLRRIWQVAAAITVALWLLWLPNQYDLLSTVDSDLSDQALVERDLEALVDDSAFNPPTELDLPGGEQVETSVKDCLPISVPNHRAVPRLAFWLDIRPSDVVSIAAADEQPKTGFFLAPANDFTVEHFILDPGEPGRAVKKPPPGFGEVARNRSWVLYTSCLAG